MANIKRLASRIRSLLADQSAVEEMEMRGRLTLMVNRNMCVGLLRGDLMVSLDPEGYEITWWKKGRLAMDLTGRPMRGFEL